MEVEYWSTLTMRGRRDVAREEEVTVVEAGTGPCRSAVSWQMKQNARV